MDSAVQTVPHHVPDHVPPELIKPFNLFADEIMTQAPFEAMDDLRQFGRVIWNSANPVFPGSWVLTQADDLRYVLSNPQLFSSQGVAGFTTLEGEDLKLIPLELDPPQHTRFRKLLNPLLSPQAMSKAAPAIAERCVTLIENVQEQGECDFVRDFAMPFPVSIFMQLMGLPEEDQAKLLAWNIALIHTGERPAGSMSVRDAAIDAGRYLEDLADKRRAAPADDIVSFVVSAEIDGQPLSRTEVKGILYLLFLAGLDTVTATLSWFFYHLAANPDQQQQLRDTPALIPRAIDELLRRYSIVVSHRQCQQDVDVAGVHMKAGDWISIIDSLGSTDPQENAKALDVDFNRKGIRHFAFSFGPHFCMGAHLARRELDIALREWLMRVPPWRLKPDATQQAHGGHTFGFDRLELEWDA